MSRLGWVAIGRNEGSRLVACLQSLQRLAGGTIVYVDSGSHDGSVAFARSIGVEVVLLDMTQPFTAARARNAGFERLMQRQPDTDFVHFIDGDCELLEGWVDEALQLLQSRSDVAAVAGRLIERHPQATVYNRLCQFEWDGSRQFGEVKSCGGIALMRTDAVRAVGGFNPALIAGEEPEMCVRLRDRQWKIWRLDTPMCLHDADIRRFGQWWKRVERAGHAYAEGVALHGRAPHFHYRDQWRRAWVWGGAIPIATAAGLLLLGWPALLALLVYPAQAFRLALRSPAGRPFRDRVLHAAFTLLGRPAELEGVLRYHWRRWKGAPPRLIEYK